MPPKHKTLWIEDDIQRDTDKLRRSISEFAREYHSPRPGSGSGSGPNENKNATNDFLKQFYSIITENELGLYKQLTATQWTTEPDGNYIEKMTFKISEIKNSANDLPRPRILDTLRHQYDAGAGRKAGNDSDDEDRYIPRVVYKYIREKSEYCIRFQTTIHQRAVSLYFITFPESHISVCHRGSGGSGGHAGVSTASVASASNYMCSTEIAMYQLYAYKVFLWLSIVTALSDKECSGQSLDVYFYMTPFKKLVPGAASSSASASAPLSAIHVNTGLTRNCETNGEIVIYRTEEWFKVFIHESMHNFNMDFIDLDLSAANKRLRDTFCIPHDDVLLFETYTETWARIINTMFETYFDVNVRNQTEFIRHVRENLSVNALFYAYQAVKVLDVMDLKYAQITILSPENMEVCRKRYAEETNVYAYYILGGILSVYALPFISWCRENNHASTSTSMPRKLSSVKCIRFSRDGGSSGERSNLIRFVDFICSAARDQVFLGMVAFCEKKVHSAASSSEVLQTTMRMTL